MQEIDPNQAGSIKIVVKDTDSTNVVLIDRSHVLNQLDFDGTNVVTSGDAPVTIDLTGGTAPLLEILSLEPAPFVGIDTMFTINILKSTDTINNVANEVALAVANLKMSPILCLVSMILMEFFLNIFHR